MRDKQNFRGPLRPGECRHAIRWPEDGSLLTIAAVAEDRGPRLRRQRCFRSMCVEPSNLFGNTWSAREPSVRCRPAPRTRRHVPPTPMSAGGYLRQLWRTSGAELLAKIWTRRTRARSWASLLREQPPRPGYGSASSGGRGARCPASPATASVLPLTSGVVFGARSATLNPPAAT